VHRWVGGNRAEGNGAGKTAKGQTDRQRLCKTKGLTQKPGSGRGVSEIRGKHAGSRAAEEQQELLPVQTTNTVYKAQLGSQLEGRRERRWGGKVREWSKCEIEPQSKKEGSEGDKVTNQRPPHANGRRSREKEEERSSTGIHVHHRSGARSKGKRPWKIVTALIMGSAKCPWYRRAALPQQDGVLYRGPRDVGCHGARGLRNPLQCLEISGLQVVLQPLP